MKVPNDDEALELMRQHGDYVKTDRIYGEIYAFDRNGIQIMFDLWIDKHTPAPTPALLSRKRQIAAAVGADSEGGDYD